jgi:integrase/recombinase XerD
LAHNALIFYYTQILKRKFYDIPFQKNPEKTKETLTSNEIKQLIDFTLNMKHKLMISMLYATGVRVSELITIKVGDIDFPRRLLLVKQGKGNKDRYTILSDNVIKELNGYLRTRKNKSHYLFETSKGHITSSTVQAVLKNAKKKAKIKKSVTPHVLRHSFATHLRDSGIQDSDIQKILGHKTLKTTQTYASVAVEHLQKIQNPHDKFKMS